MTDDLPRGPGARYRHRPRGGDPPEVAAAVRTLVAHVLRRGAGGRTLAAIDPATGAVRGFVHVQVGTAAELKPVADTLFAALEQAGYCNAEGGPHQ